MICAEPGCKDHVDAKAGIAWCHAHWDQKMRAMELSWKEKDEERDKDMKKITKKVAEEVIGVGYRVAECCGTCMYYSGSMYVGALCTKEKDKVRTWDGAVCNRYESAGLTVSDPFAISDPFAKEYCHG